jgi:hypothetical protein
MSFQIRGLDDGQFSHLFGKPEEVLAEYGIERVIVDSAPGFPCRVSLRDAAIGESALFMNYEHQPALSPYRSSHAIFVREGASTADIPENEVPGMLRIRLISIRAFDSAGIMLDADIGDGTQLETFIDQMFAMQSVSYLHLHNAQRGCFMARVERT